MNTSLLARISFTTLALLLAFAPVFASASACPNLYRNLSFGSRGNDVTELQTFLIAQGDLAAGNNTGYFGRMTESAVKSWQAKNGVVSSGTAATTGYGAVGP
ncbi:MAG: peptidoglycan-binding domain-containing protein, partial [Patescibacteria group bacterium]